MSAHILDGKEVAAAVREEVAERVAALAPSGKVPGLATVLVGDDPASHVYVRSKRRLAEKVGINSIHHELEATATQEEVEGLVEQLIVEREEDIEAFKAREYWTIEADISKGKQPFTAKLTQLEGEKISQFSITDEQGATAAEKTLSKAAGSQLQVLKIEKKQRRRNPAPPFITSTLQQEASRKLGYTAKRTMRIAQQLYEGVDIGSGAVGLIGGVFAAPGLLLVGAPFGERDLYPLAVGGSVLLWLLVGLVFVVVSTWMAAINMLLALKGSAYLLMRLGEHGAALERLEKVVAMDAGNRLGAADLLPMARAKVTEQAVEQARLLIVRVGH